MRRRQALVLMAGAAALLGCGPRAVPGAAGAQAMAVRLAGSWGRAITVPGLLALNKGRHAGVSSVSCPSAGNCAAAGVYTDGGGHWQGFVVSERNGRWRQAMEVPGLGALNKRRNAEVLSVSCASPGNCAAGGYYGNHGNNPYVVTSGRGFVASERNGRWRQAVKVPGLGALNKGGNAEVSSVSCPSTGNCAAGGDYTDASGAKQAFVVSEVNGRWGTAREAAGILNTGRGAGVDSVSCASAGNCSAGGFYSEGPGGQVAFVINEVNGTWASAQEVPGTDSGSNGEASVTSLSCASAGNCSAGGTYDVTHPYGVVTAAFVVSEVNRIWGTAQDLADTESSSGPASVTSVSCASAGNCSAGGYYDYGGYNAAFVVSEKNGAWGKAIDVPGLNAVSRDAYLYSVSCASAGNCAVGGSHDNIAFVASQKNGVWGKEITLPLPDGEVISVSCAAAGPCVAGGYYSSVTGRRFSQQGFVTQ